MRVLKLVFDWSEVWALMIPIFFILIKKNKSKYLRPIVVYVFMAFFINLFADIIADFKIPFHFPIYFQTNTFLYNTHSIIRFVCFSYFFLLLNSPFSKTFTRVVQVVGFTFTIIYFCFENFNNPNHISGDFLAIEALLMLIICMLYFLTKLKDDHFKPLESPDFYIALGLSIYVVINFFVFLFYIPMIEDNAEFANQMWSIHNAAYIILCIFIAKAFNTPTPSHAT